MTQSEHQAHLTPEQLSAFLDKQLAPTEQALLNTHLASCAQCQRVLADLRATVALVRALPMPAVPRSFTLPGNIAPFPIQPVSPVSPVTQETRQPVRAGAQAQRPPASLKVMRRSLRLISAIAACLGLLFVLSGLPLLVSGHTGNATSAPELSSGGSTYNTNPSTGPRSTPNVVGTRGPVRTGTGTGPTSQTPVPQQSPTPAPTPTSTSTGLTVPPPKTPGGGPALPPFLDPGTTLGRLSLGLALVVLGIIGLFVSSRLQRRAIS